MDLYQPPQQVDDEFFASWPTFEFTNPQPRAVPVGSYVYTSALQTASNSHPQFLTGNETTFPMPEPVYSGQEIEAPEEFVQYGYGVPMSMDNMSLEHEIYHQQLPVPTLYHGHSIMDIPHHVHIPYLSTNDIEQHPPESAGIVIQQGERHHFHHTAFRAPLSQELLPAGNIHSVLPNEFSPAQQINFRKRKPFSDPQLREQTAQTRKTGSCIKCRIQRIRCESDPNMDCSSCRTSRSKILPCLRLKITDIKLYKPCQEPSMEWHPQRASSETKTIRISEAFSKTFLDLQVCKVIQQETDKLYRTWDVDKSMATPYGLTDTYNATLAYKTHIQDSMIKTLEHMSLGGLIEDTYIMALRVCQDSSTPLDVFELLESTLRLWVSIRLSTAPYFIVGEETLSMPPNQMRTGYLLPPILGAQLDHILTRDIQRQRRVTLHKLQKSTLKKSNRFAVYLATFILLHNTALIIAHDAKYARMLGMEGRFAHANEVHEYRIGATTLLAYFHYCNHDVRPFSDGCKDNYLKESWRLDSKKMEFVRKTRSSTKDYRQKFAELVDQNAYEDELYFVSQLFDENWQP